MESTFLSKLNVFFSPSWFQKSITNFPLPTLFLSRVTPLSSQNVMIHHGQTQEYVLKPKYFAAQKVISGEQSTEGSFPLTFKQGQVMAPFQCEYSPVNGFFKLQHHSLETFCLV